MGRFEDQAAGPFVQNLLENGDQDDNRIIYIKERRSRWSAITSWLISFFLGVIATSLLYGTMMRPDVADVVMTKLGATKHSTYSLANTDPYPDVPQETVTFEANRVFSDRSTDDTDFAWDMLLPPGRGFVFVPDADARGLPPGESTTWGDIYSVAMYHQLHCLARIRKSYWMMHDGITTGETTIARQFAGRTASDHVQHCFDYLRQSVMCNGDMTLEWPKLDGPSSGAKVDGWGIPHVCKSPTAIKEYMDEYHFNSSIVFDAAG